MTSYTKKLYQKDPNAAEAFHRQSRFERARRDEALATITLPDRPFGKRQRTSPVVACASPCGHPACIHGCTSRGNWGAH